jgi:hypothetical protein
MKTQINFFQLSRLLFVAAIHLLVFSGIFFTACQKESATDDITDDTTDAVLGPEDLVAWFNPFTNELLVAPGYEQHVLDVLGARSLQKGTYMMQGINLYGEPRQVTFQMFTTQNTNITVTANQVEAAPLPELIETFTKGSTTYRVYQNATCGKVSKAFEGPCTNNTDGTSFKNSWYDTRHCERGDGFCTEAYSVIGRKSTYHNSNCQGPVKSEAYYYGYACWQ